MLKNIYKDAPLQYVRSFIVKRGSFPSAVHLRGYSMDDNKRIWMYSRDNLMTGDWISDSRDLEERLFCHEKRNSDNR